MARVQRRFASPSAFEACTNPNVKVVYGRVREGAPDMAAAFCVKRAFRAGEFICAWNAVQIVDNDDDVNRLSNAYDLSKYALSFALCDRANTKVYSCPRLDKTGKPLPLPLTEGDVGERRDVSLAVFLNEPSPGRVTKYDARTDVVHIYKASRVSANVCLRTQKQRNGVVCPLLFASRLITPGEELTWDYGSEEYDRRLYQIDAEKGIFSVGEEKYPATEAASNRCGITCDTVEFESGLPIEPFSRDLFLIDADGLTDDERQLVEFKSRRYLEMLQLEDDASVDTTSVASTSSPPPPAKKQKRTRRAKRRTITVQSMQEELAVQFTRERSALVQLAEEVQHRLAAVTPGRIKNQKKLCLISLLKRVLQPAMYLAVEEVKPGGREVVHHFPRREFVPYLSDRDSFVEENDVMWKDVMKMQRRAFLTLDSIIDRLKGDPKESVEALFKTHNFTSIYVRPDGREETIDDWKSPEFAEEHPTAHEVGMRFLLKLEHIRAMVHRHDAWSRAGPDDADQARIFEKSRAVALDMLQANAYEQVNSPAIFDAFDAIVSTVSKGSEPDRTQLTVLAQGEGDDAMRAAAMLNALREPEVWRSEAMLVRL